MKTRHSLAPVVLVCSLLVSHSALAQFVQQGSKLVGTGAVGGGLQGDAVCLSADGNTAIVGGRLDDNGAGAAWIWTKSGGVWTQQGTKLVASDATANAQQGTSVALSADGNTAIVGGWLDGWVENTLIGPGAAWVWTRNGESWSQQGPKLVGSDYAGLTRQGISVALSADGNTAIVGGHVDNGATGAAWVWTRSGGVWSQQGPKLVGSGGFNGVADQGFSVALSADGNTAIVGGPHDNGQIGAAWVWTRTGGVWTQQGSKLVGTGVANFSADQGHSVSLSADGNTALVGGYGDDHNAGAVWVWTRSGGVWTQQGSKLVGSGAIGNAGQGVSVSLSADGNKAMIGAYADNSFIGAAWVWTRSAGVWSQQGSKLIGSGAAGNANQGVSVSLAGDGNTAFVGGFGDDNSVGATWFFAAPDLTIVKSHNGNFHMGDTGDTYTILVTNAGAVATSGTVTVSDTLPAGLTPTGPNGAAGGWSCSVNAPTLTCTRSDVLAAGASYPAITLTVNVANNAASSLTNTATVSGGGEGTPANNTASDLVTITAPSIPPAPAGVLAAAISSTQVAIAWTAVAGASYQIERQAAGGVSLVGTSVTNSFTDATPSADSAYLYRVRAVNGAGTSINSAPDLATTVIFTDNPLTPGVFLMNAVHLSQLRIAINAVQLLAGQTASSFTDAATPGTPIRAIHVTELRSTLDAARGALVLSTGGYTDVSLVGVGIKAVHSQQLRDRVQ
jgi:uncharacterized repeat protein (TIGR01451 family)